jgi:predicted AAA+ superfamily ATPase
LPPWFESLGKRQVKSPKVYFQDSGLLHALMGIETMAQLLENPRLGASWEGFVLNAVIQATEVPVEDCYFWATHNGAEIDLLIIKGKTRLGFEIKRSEAPSVTPSMRIAMKDLKLDHLYVIHAGEDNYPLGERMEALAFKSFLRKIKPL